MSKAWEIAKVLLALLFVDSPGDVIAATTYDVGPNKKLSAIAQVPWESLNPGDTVLIHWRAKPHKEKFVICRQGKADAPITVRGVPGPAGQLPIIDGDGATTRSNLNYWGDIRSVIKIGGAVNPPDTMPQHIVIENLDIRSGRPPFSFTAANGETRQYVAKAAALYVEKAEHLTIRNCILHDSGNGLFISSNDERASRNILVEGNYIYDNGNLRSGREHNVYTAAIGIVFQSNRFGPLRANCLGNNLKDRSAGLVVRYNWIEGGDKQLDLVDAEDSALIRRDPQYRQTFVYGNIMLEPKGAGHPFIVHYGGDSPKLENYRKGTLFFYNNTIVSTRLGRTTLFRFSTNDEQCDYRNNIACVTAKGSSIGVLENKGVVNLSHNWFASGWKKCFSPKLTVRVHDDGTSLDGTSPGFVDLAVQDFHLSAGSPCRDRGVAPNEKSGTRNAPLPHVDRQYVKHQSSEARPSDGKPDIGAFEFGAR